MNFNRSLYSELVKWKSKDNRKPLILRGARQVGKTTLVNEFAKTYKNKIYLNLEKSDDRAFFETTDNVKRIVEAIFISNNISNKDTKETLLFIDEVQEHPKAIKLLRYFYEELPELHLITAGSLLEFALKEVESFPVGRVEFLYLHPFNFQEYLEATEHNVALEQLKQVPVNKAAHSTLLKLFNTYAIMGGMPEVVKQYVKTKTTTELANIYESIWASYISDTEKYARSSSTRNVIKHVMKTAPILVDQRVKFQNFGGSNYKSKEVGEALRDLDQAKIIRLIYPTTSVEVPILPDQKKRPRLQILDTGIINYLLEIIPELLMMDDLSSGYKGAIIPHILTQELISLQTNTSKAPHFWVREKVQSTAEVDLVYVFKNKVIPIEIKSGTTGSLKSLHQFVDKAPHPYAIRIYGGEFEIQEAKTPNGTPYLLMNLPYYAMTEIERYVEYFTERYSLIVDI